MNRDQAENEAVDSAIPATVDLIRKARAGDNAARNELIETWRTWLLYVANSELDPELKRKLGPSDLVQSACIDVHRCFDDFRGESEQEWKAWLRQLLIHDLQDARRRFLVSEKRDVSRERNLANRSSLGARIVKSGISPRAEMIEEEEREAIRQALQTLTAEHREVLQLRGWDQLPFAEVGQRMNRSEDAAQKLWTRAVAQLQRALDRQLEQNPE